MAHEKFDFAFEHFDCKGNIAIGLADHSPIWVSYLRNETIKPGQGQDVCFLVAPCASQTRV